MVPLAGEKAGGEPSGGEDRTGQGQELRGSSPSVSGLTSRWGAVSPCCSPHHRPMRPPATCSTGPPPSLPYVSCSGLGRPSSCTGCELLEAVREFLPPALVPRTKHSTGSVNVLLHPPTFLLFSVPLSSPCSSNPSCCWGRKSTAMDGGA